MYSLEGASNNALLGLIKPPAMRVVMTSAPATGQIGQPLSVTIEVGKLLAHPNEPGHHIEWIDIYEGYLFLARVGFSGGRVSPKVTLELMLKKGGLLRAYASCNLHGVWEGCKDVNVS